MKFLRPSAFVAKLKAHWLWASGSFILVVFTAEAQRGLDSSNSQVVQAARDLQAMQA